jgi:hypothetical protein
MVRASRMAKDEQVMDPSQGVSNSVSLPFKRSGEMRELRNASLRKRTTTYSTIVCINAERRARDQVIRTWDAKLGTGLSFFASAYVSMLCVGGFNCLILRGHETFLSASCSRGSAVSEWYKSLTAALYSSTMSFSISNRLPLSQSATSTAQNYPAGYVIHVRSMSGA